MRLQQQQQQLLLTALVCALLLAYSTAAAPSPSPSPSSSLPPSPSPTPQPPALAWILAGLNRTSPSCSLCLNALGGPERSNWTGIPVGVYRCAKRDANEVWVVDAAGASIYVFPPPPQQRPLCLDAGPTAPAGAGALPAYMPLRLAECDPASPRQRWVRDETTGQIRSGVRDAAGGSAYLAQGELRPDLPGLDTGTAAYYNLYLATEAGFRPDLGFVGAHFSVVYEADVDDRGDRTDGGGAEEEDKEAEAAGGVRNGGFERCTVVPTWPDWQNCTDGMGVRCSKNVLYAGELFPLCGWEVVSPPEWVHALDPGVWTAASGTGSLLLRDAASVRQSVPTPRVGERYRLTFAMAGYLARDLDRAGAFRLCGAAAGFVAVTVDAAAPVAFDLGDADVSQPGAPTRWVTQAVEFDAAGPRSVVTLASVGNFACAPAIDDVRLALAPGSTNGTGGTTTTKRASSSPSTSVGVVAGGAATALAVAVAAGLAACLCLRHRRRRRREQRSRSLLRVAMAGSGDSAGAAAAHKVRTYSYAELQKATADWTAVVGHGGFSTVYRAQLADGGVAAVKVEKSTDKNSHDEGGGGSLFREELSVLLRVNHRYLVNIIGVCAEKDHPILVFEYLPNGTLHQRLHHPHGPNSATTSTASATTSTSSVVSAGTHGPLSWQARMKIIYQVSCALEYLHHGTNPPVVHRDIKSANILLTAADSAKLADFGLSRSAPADASTATGHPAAALLHTRGVKGSLGYLDPKYLRTGVYSLKSDVYSYGVLLLETVSGHTAIKDADLLTVWAAPFLQPATDAAAVADPMGMVDARLPPGDVAASDLRTILDLARMCLHDEPHRRPTMHRVVALLTESRFSGCPLASSPVTVPGELTVLNFSGSYTTDDNSPGGGGGGVGGGGGRPRGGGGGGAAATTTSSDPSSSKYSKSSDMSSVY